MKRSFFLACCLASIAAPAAFAATLAPAGTMTVAQVIDKNVAARGGLQAWRAVDSITLSGEMDAGGKQDTKLPFVMSMKRPHKSRLEIRFLDRPAVQVFDGVQGWKQRPFLGRDDVEAFTPAETKSAAAAAELDGPLVDYARKGTKAEMLGIEPVEGKNAYKLKLTTKTGEQLNVWVDATSFLEVKIDGEPRKLDGRMHKVAVYMRDYKSEGGLVMPRVLETVVEGVKQSRKMTIQTVKVNQVRDDSPFAKPQVAVVKAAAAQ